MITKKITLMKKKFITSALPYVNNQPHLGNIIGSVLSADVYSRFSRNSGDDVVFVCGTDEFGTATEMEAMNKKVHPRDIVQKNRKLHEEVYKWFNIDFDVFGHTDSPEHIERTQEFFWQCYNNGFFEKTASSQFFCENCEQFLADRYVEGECSICKFDNARGDQCDGCGRCLKVEELKKPICVICKKTPIMKTTDHLFLRLDLLQEKIKSTFEKEKDSWSSNAIAIYNEWIQKTLHPRCMTRLLKYKWGVPVPLNGFEDKVFYVWFDAPIGYFTFLANKKTNWREWVKDAEFIQFMGKDNVFFHSIIFPGMILATKGLMNCLPNENIKNSYPIVNIINSTEYLNFNGKKFSKSRNIGIFGMDLVKNDMGCSDFWRFYLILRRPESYDSDFNINDFKSHVNGDLISNFGNFCNRVMQFILKKLNGKIEVGELDVVDKKFIDEINSLFKSYKNSMNKIALRDGLQKVLEISSKGNKYLQDLQNNKCKKNHGYSLCYSLILFLGKLIEPFTPEAANKIFDHFGIKEAIILDDFTIIQSAEFKNCMDTLFSKFTPEQLSKYEYYL